MDRFDFVFKNRRTKLTLLSTLIALQVSPEGVRQTVLYSSTDTIACQKENLQYQSSSFVNPVDSHPGELPFLGSWWCTGGHRYTLGDFVKIVKVKGISFVLPLFKASAGLEVSV